MKSSIKFKVLSQLGPFLAYFADIRVCSLCHNVRFRHFLPLQETSVYESFASLGFQLTLIDSHSHLHSGAVVAQVDVHHVRDLCSWYEEVCHTIFGTKPDCYELSCLYVKSNSAASSKQHSWPVTTRAQLARNLLLLWTAWSLAITLRTCSPDAWWRKKKKTWKAFSCLRSRPAKWLKDVILELWLVCIGHALASRNKSFWLRSDITRLLVFEVITRLLVPFDGCGLSCSVLLGWNKSWSIF